MTSEFDVPTSLEASKSKTIKSAHPGILLLLVMLFSFDAGLGVSSMIRHLRSPLHDYAWTGDLLSALGQIVGAIVFALYLMKNIRKTNQTDRAVSR